MIKSLSLVLVGMIIGMLATSGGFFLLVVNDQVPNSSLVGRE